MQANARLTNGQIILMHEWPANTLAAIPRIAQVLASHGLWPGTSLGRLATRLAAVISGLPRQQAQPTCVRHGKPSASG